MIKTSVTEKNKKKNRSPTENFNLGLTHSCKEGCDNILKALQFLREAAEPGHVGAQYNLGLMFYEGRKAAGMGKDFNQALLWFEFAAKEKHAGALYYLGLMYENGEGVDKNKNAAARLYCKAAKQGITFAQKNMKLICYGKGVMEDEREVYIWFLITEANGSKVVAKKLPENHWQQILTSEEMESAEQEATRRLNKIEEYRENKK